MDLGEEDLSEGNFALSSGVGALIGPGLPRRRARYNEVIADGDADTDAVIVGVGLGLSI